MTRRNLAGARTWRSALRREALRGGCAPVRLPIRMKRRIFLATALLPAVSQAQQRPPLIGVMRVNARSVEQFAEPFRRDMTRLGWEEGRTYRTHFLWADGDTSRLSAMAAELLTSGATLMVAFSNPAVAAVQAATKQVPIVGMSDD